MASLRQYADADGELDLASFQDAVAILMEFMQTRFDQGDNTARPVSGKAGQTYVQQILGEMPFIGKRGSTTRSQSPSTRQLQSPRRMFSRVKIHRSSNGLPVISLKAVEKSNTVELSLPETVRDSISVSTPRAHVNEPFEETKPSVLLVRTHGGGIKMGTVSGDNVPEIDVSDPNLLVSTVIAKLCSRGWNVQAMASEQPPELVFTLFRAGRSTISSIASKLTEQEQTFIKPPLPPGPPPHPAVKEMGGREKRKVHRTEASNAHKESSGPPAYPTAPLGSTSQSSALSFAEEAQIFDYGDIGKQSALV